MRKKQCVAMLLAGGQGSRLGILTKDVAKPAVPYGGKYRIIDFPLSNCINSGIDTVGVLTQYQPLALNEYIGNGQPWDLDRVLGGIMVLPPYQGSKRADWYKGTANAIYQNMNFIERYDPEYVVVLSGDHIYKMDYSEMVRRHKETQADCTIAVFHVTPEETSRFGIMSTDKEGRIVKFEEKPKQTDSTQASMGVYVFSKEKLFQYLEEDEHDPESENDFGRNIIPKMLAAGERMFAFPFSGYWKDVGTIQSLWEANMDLLGDRPALDLRDESWRIFSRNYAEPPHFIGANAVVGNSLVTEGCEIYGSVINSVISGDVVVEKGAVVKDSVILDGVRICEGAQVHYSILDADTTVGRGASVGCERKNASGLTLVGGGLAVPEGAVIPDGVRADGALIASLAHTREAV